MGNDSLEIPQNESPKKSPEASKYCEEVKSNLAKDAYTNSLYIKTLTTNINDGQTIAEATKSANYIRKKNISSLEDLSKNL